jgi:hypothetical protein
VNTNMDLTPSFPPHSFFRTEEKGASPAIVSDCLPHVIGDFCGLLFPCILLGEPGGKLVPFRTRTDRRPLDGQGHK